MDIKERVKLLLKLKSHININLGAGETLVKGFINVDMVEKPGIDVVWDLEEFPWPFPDNCADLLIASQLVEHINPHKGVFIQFMDEAWRILKVGGQFMISTPYGSSDAYVQDPTHCNPCNQLTWSYFDPMDDMTGGNLYKNYKPNPWKIIENSWYSNGNMEILLEKRPDDPKYRTPEIINNRTIAVFQEIKDEKKKEKSSKA